MTTINRSKTYSYFDWPRCALFFSVHANFHLKCLFGDWITSAKNWLLESFVIFWLYLFYLWLIQWALSIFFLQYNFFSTIYYDCFPTISLIYKCTLLVLWFNVHKYNSVQIVYFLSFVFEVCLFCWGDVSYSWSKYTFHNICIQVCSLPGISFVCF